MKRDKTRADKNVCFMTISSSWSDPRTVVDSQQGYFSILGLQGYKATKLTLRLVKGLVNKKIVVLRGYPAGEHETILNEDRKTSKV